MNRLERLKRKTAGLALLFGALLGLALCATTAASRGQQNQRAQSAAEVFRAAQRDLQAGRYTAAELGFREVLRLDPQSPAAYANLGVVYLRTNRFREAVEALDQAARLAPKAAGIQLNLGLAYLRQNQFREAIPHFRQALNLEPAQDQPRYLLGLSCFMADDYKEAAQTLEPLHSTFSSHVDYLFILGSCYTKVGRKDEAEKVFGQMIQAGGDSPRIHWLLGNAYLADFLHESAVKEFEKAAVDPTLPYVHYSLGLAFYRLGNSDRALQEIDKEIAVDPNYASAYGLRGSIYADIRQMDKAIESFEKSIQLNPNQAAAFYGLGKACLLKGEAEKAVKNLERAARMSPDNDQVHFQLGRAYLKAGRKADGERELAHAQKLQAAEREKLEKQVMGELPPSPVQTWLPPNTP